MGLLPNAYHVARREYLVRVRGRAFVVTTVLLAIAVVGVVLLPTILGAIGIDDPPHVAVDVQADDVAGDPILVLQSALLLAEDPIGGGDAEDDAGTDTTGSGADADARPRVTRATDPEAAAEAVRDGELDALLTISRDGDGELAFEYLGSANPTNRTRLIVTQAAGAIAVADRLDRSGVDPSESAALFRPPDFTAVPADPEDAMSEAEFGGALLLAYAVVVLTFMAILTYGNWVAQSVAEEKSGRVMELLITAATPRQLLTGKVVGTGAAGLTQYVAILVAATVGFLAAGPVGDALGVADGGALVLPPLSPGLVLAFALFFLLGFVLYSTLYAAAGSMVSRIEDVQQAAGPLVFLAIAGYFASFTGLNDPDAGWVQVLALVPFFSPYLMPARILLTSVSGAEVVLALGLLAVTVALAIVVASRIYSAGVLLYGQRVGLRNAWRATRVAR